ncbi:ribose transport system permease protein [Halogranum gelatinilyticum]|uniref:Ribose transport system permease protein n=2 Tax=Halogranum gelatinilyticum TaxID=660521 RepID=A0A1G9ZTZ1_9EURY|nr:ABC transporter permease [Halogranum gelatinilyticum]SDN24381.1 ribose transport system permease protein [Halogranum gelatinilyticum]
MSTSSVSKWITAQREQRTLQDWIQDLGPFVMLFGLMLIFTFTTERFFTEANLLDNVAKNAVTLLLVALAGTFPILQQSIDLSVESVVLLTGVVTVVLISQFGLGLLAIPLAIGVGMLAGLFNGIVFTKLKVPSFLVTLGTLSVMAGVGKIITGGSTITFRNPAIRTISTGDVLGIPNLVLWGLLIYVITIVLAFRTKFGRYCFALGENERVVELAGAKVDRYKIYPFVLSGLLCGIAGVLLTLRISSASPNIGSGLLLPSIAAIVMGGTALTGGVGGPHRTILGVLVIAVLNNGMNLLGIDSFVQEIILGLVVVAAVALSIDRAKIDVVK